MVPHGWMTETKKKVGIAYNIVNLFETWRTELTACNESLWKVYIRRFFRGILFHLCFFAVVIVPLLIILNETNLGYVTSRDQKLNDLLFMDDLSCTQRVTENWISLFKP